VLPGLTNEYVLALNGWTLDLRLASFLQVETSGHFILVSAQDDEQ
jgi:hypothetical protein